MASWSREEPDVPPVESERGDLDRTKARWQKDAALDTIGLLACSIAFGAVRQPGSAVVCVAAATPALTFVPELLREGEGVEAHVVPPRSFVAGVMKLAMMGAADRDSELVTDLAAESLRLGKADMMCVSGDCAAENTGS